MGWLINNVLLAQYVGYVGLFQALALKLLLQNVHIIQVNRIRHVQEAREPCRDLRRCLQLPRIPFLGPTGVVVNGR
jgi:hypothetical protein